MFEWDDEANQIFLEAIELSTPQARTTYLTEMCGTRLDLRQRVAELLEANAVIGDFLEQPACQLLTAPVPLTTAGPYQILEPLGEGGMGIVYLAMQETPVRRQVALKVIKPGMDSQQVIARFEAERQALALMDHPNIARVLDAGTTDSGRPYFAMELVNGIPITKYCQQKSLSRQARLKLFLDVCLAVSHAHQKGIIHRDLKPSNILVTEQSGRPVVKVIDFGIAKAIGQSLTERTLHTGFAQIVGTPVYMSPEQSQFNSADIDTRSDVYSLGVLLYELLTGTTPFSEDVLRQVGPDAFRLMIQHEDPPRPSARISNLSSVELSALLGNDQTTLSRFRSSLRGELDWIVMQAMDKDRSRRYESVSELAADGERYLHGEPVRACPPTTWYMLRKLTYRYRTALSTGVIVLLALVGGMTIAIWQAVDAVEARNLADKRYRESQDSLRAASIARQRADEERDKARASSERANRLLYAGDIQAALRAWQHNDVRKMRELLSRHIPEGNQQDLRGFEWYFLWRHTRLESEVVFQSPKPLHCVRVSPDGKTVAVTGADGQIHLLSSGTYAGQATLATTHVEVNGVEFSLDGTELVSAGDDGKVVVWNLATRLPGLSFQAYEQPAFCALFSHEWIITCGKHPNLRQWGRQDGHLERELTGHQGSVQSVTLSRQGYIAGGSDDFTVSCWDLAKTDPLWHDLQDASAKVNVIAFNAAGWLLAIGRTNGILSLRAANNGKLIVEQQFPDSLHSLAFSPRISGTPLSLLAIGDRGGSIHLVPMNDTLGHSGLTGSSPEHFSIRQLQGHDGRVYSLTFTADAGQLLSAGEDGLLRVWNLNSDQSSRALGSEVQDFAVVDQEHVVTTGKQLLLHDLRTAGSMQEVSPLQGVGRFVQYNAATDRIFFTDTMQGLVATSRTGTDHSVIRPPTEGQRPDRIAVSADGRQIALVVEDGHAHWVEFPGKPELAPYACESVVHDVEFSPNGDGLIVDQVRDVRVIQLPSKQSSAPWKGHRSTIQDIARSPDLRHFATASRDRQVKVWEWPSGREAWSEMAHAIESGCVAFSPDGNTLATSGEDRLLRLWRWKQDMLVFEYPLEDWPAKKLEFTPDGNKLLVLARNRLRLYDGTPDKR